MSSGKRRGESEGEIEEARQMSRRTRRMEYKLRGGQKKQDIMR